jgi:hypothetical protein
MLLPFREGTLDHPSCAMEQSVVDLFTIVDPTYSGPGTCSPFMPNSQAPVTHVIGLDYIPSLVDVWSTIRMFIVHKILY